MDKITKEKVEQYKNLTSAALEMAEKSINRKRREEANEIISMVKNYISDSNYFQSKGDLVSAFAALNYAHGWLDAGARLGIFNVKDSRLFTVK